MSDADAPILVIGINAGGAASLPVALQKRIACADLLVGGARQLAYFPTFAGEQLPITASIAPVVARLRQALAAGKRVVVLASGDPLWYGIGASLRHEFPASALQFVPAPTAFQLAFAALGEAWHDAALLNAHARPLEAVVAGACAAPKAAILTDQQHTPARVAQALLAAGFAPTSRCVVCENLGGPQQRIVDSVLSVVAEGSFADLNVVLVWNQAVRPAHAPGLPDEAFSTERGLITRRELRLLSLAELALGAGELMWDIGAGSGAVAIEAARSQPSATVYAVERHPARCQHIRENLRRFPAPNLHLTEGGAPEACVAWPRPHAVFVGGSGGALPALVELACEQLWAGGRLVINLVTLEHLYRVQTLLPGANVVQVQINRAVPIQASLRFEALNPVFVVSWRKAAALGAAGHAACAAE